MSKGKLFSFNPQLPTVTAFLGGLTFTAMILIIQFSENFALSYFPPYPELLISFSAVVSFFFIMSTIGGAVDQRNAALITSNYRSFVYVLLVLAWVGLLILIPAFLLPFSLIGTIVLVIIEVICMIAYIKLQPGIVGEDELP